MKKLLVIIVLFTSTFCIAQNRDSPAVTIFYAYCPNTVFNMGLACKNLSPGHPLGFYFIAEGFNTAYEEGPSGDDLFNSAFGWTDTYETSNKDLPNFGMSVGTTYNLNKLFKKENLGLTLFTGIGYSRFIRQEETITSRSYNNQYLDPSIHYDYTNIVDETKITFESFIDYDLIPSGSFSISIMAGANSSIGFLVSGSVGFRF